VLDLQERVCARLGVSTGEASAGTPGSSTAVITERLAEALADLHAAGAIELSAAGVLIVTAEGRRLTETEVGELRSAPPEEAGAEDVTEEGQKKPTLKNYVAAVFESFGFRGPSG
jgi:hypothetical protein